MVWTDYVDGSSALWGLFVSAFVSSTLAPGGSEAVLAYLVKQSAHEPTLLLFVATLGNTLGALTTWVLGYWAGLRFPADRPLDPKRHKAIVTVQKWGMPLLLLSWLPLVGDGFCFAAGWLKLPFWTSLLAMAVGKLGRYAAITYALSS